MPGLFSKFASAAGGYATGAGLGARGIGASMLSRAGQAGYNAGQLGRYAFNSTSRPMRGAIAGAAVGGLYGGIMGNGVVGGALMGAGLGAGGVAGFDSYRAAGGNMTKMMTNTMGAAGGAMGSAVRRARRGYAGASMAANQGFNAFKAGAGF